MNFKILCLLLSVVSAQKGGTGTCHPYPGASGADVLTLISNNLNNEDMITLDGNGFGAITYRTASIAVKGKPGTKFETDEIVRSALTSVGACALNDRGSVSGYYTMEDDTKVCYLFAGKESLCA